LAPAYIDREADRAQKGVPLRRIGERCCVPEVAGRINGMPRAKRRITWIDPFISANRGALAGDLLWLGGIGFILAIITGMIAERAGTPFSLHARFLAP
jgi:hypothetical protein